MAAQVASGLRKYYEEADLLDRRVLVVCNLKPRRMGRFESQGMVLCASSEDKERVEVCARRGDRGGVGAVGCP